MIDDIIEGLIKFCGSLLYKLFFDIIGFYTGEIILFVISLGRKKPRWDYYAEAKPTRFVIFTEFSVWIGLAFWGFIMALVIWIIIK